MSGALLLATGAAAGRLVAPPTSSATALDDAPTVEPTVEEPTEEPTEERRGWLTEAVINVTNARAQTVDEPPVVHVKLPKGEDISLTMPQGRRTWSFRWPDVLKTATKDEMPRTYEVMEPRELFGTYTIIIVDYSIMACNGFEGDPRNATGTLS
ncbi:hypothetical protein [Streptomyces tanashiensis]|uniref:hypothetical protein n=1 Tax=Streptomyces tanashiensis TaxID=67367 RepID=UPI0033DA55BA